MATNQLSLTYELPEHAAEVLSLFAFGDGADLGSYGLWWRSDGGKTTFYASCSDTFWWATADVEPILPNDMPILRQAYTDLVEIGDGREYLLAELFAARKRKMRPMRKFLATTEDDVVELFLAAGPERDPKSEG